MTWVTYLKASVEIILIIFLGCLMFYLFKTQPLSHAIGISVFLIILFVVLDGFLLRGTFFKIKEGFDESNLDGLSEKEQMIQKVLKGYNKEDNKELKIKNLKVTNKLECVKSYDIFEYLFPKGTILIMEKNPQDVYKFGEWKALAAPDGLENRVRFLRIKKPGDKHYNTDDKGNYIIDSFNAVDLTEKQIPYHDHDIFTRQTVAKRSHHKVFAEGTDPKDIKAAYKLYVNSITRSEAENSTNDTFKSLADHFVYNTPHNNISPFISFNMWERVG